MSKLLKFERSETSPEKVQLKPGESQGVFDLTELREKYRKDRKDKEPSAPLTVEDIYDLLTINQVPPEDIEAICRAEGIHEGAIPLLKIIAEQIDKIREYEKAFQNRSLQTKQHDTVVRSLLRRIQILEDERKKRW
ncbi:MAG: hypothetical protein HYT62_04680 [Candidatus Yanofskybacteria bacterium]|nr:hypothetical protein [Candidatus Yanofskybacteria bacterium]